MGYQEIIFTPCHLSELNSSLLEILGDKYPLLKALVTALTIA